MSSIDQLHLLLAVALKHAAGKVWVGAQHLLRICAVQVLLQDVLPFNWIQ
jgi:hypothetical protein